MMDFLMMVDEWNVVVMVFMVVEDGTCDGGDGGDGVVKGVWVWIFFGR
ncbi:hypothetical protein RchiOBHm_Chr5g0014191 [Rosa chinensis]|uniref:Uncharacterized protein n=1 Tax=Rosa chinensis TaxID=74649 RepID=A0A2P6Q5K6_ROSCH|nr:hypothetical protein RchiOBHm_Chr5g0014191 [Rosa chinensis]